jgi:hypothetical protein
MLFADQTAFAEMSRRDGDTGNGRLCELASSGNSCRCFIEE